MTAIQEFILRQSTEADIDPICEFLVHNWHAFNAKRRIDALTFGIEHRRIFLLEDIENHRIHAVSAIFDHLGKYWQAGMARVSASVGGYGINELFHRVRAVHAQIIDRTFLAYFAAIESSNKRSVENALKVGFEAWTDPPPQLKYQAITQSDKDLQFYQLSIAQISRFARWLLDAGDTVQLSRINRESKKEETIQVALLVESLMLYKYQVEELAELSSASGQE